MSRKMTKTSKCLDCLFFDPISAKDAENTLDAAQWGTSGHCLRLAPRPRMRDSRTGHEDRADWPLVWDYDRCGEFEPTALRVRVHHEEGVSQQAPFPRE